METGVFPKGFLWGAATASAQVEGGHNADGRTFSIWDIAPSEKIKNGENNHITCDHYHHYKEDVKLMKEIGLNSYRFSISWSRVIPEEGKINPKGVAFYQNLVTELLNAGIEPIVTIYHWDLPLWVHKKGGWLSSKIVDMFRDYTKVVVDALSDKVRWWITINEPQSFIMNGYLQGIHAPFKRNYLAMSKLSRNCMLAHAASVKTIRQYAKKKPMIGFAMATGCFVPDDETPAAIEQARKDSFEKGLGLMSNRWWMDPMLFGKTVQAYGIYRMREKDMKEICQPLDFIGINVYQPFNYAEWGGNGTKPKPGAPKTSIGWFIDERVLYWTARFIHERYKLPIMVTENGMTANDFVCMDGKVHDGLRIDFIHRYLGSMKRAVQEGIPILGYQYWSLLDNFEWAEGYDARFGLIHVDYASGNRTLKDSAYAYQKIIAENGI